MLGLTTAEVTAVATFYTMYRRKPSRRLPGRRLHQHAVRGDGRRRHLRRAQASTSASATTRPPTDGKVTLEHIECNAACDFAPVVMVNWEFFDNQTPESAKAAGRRPAGRPRPSTPTRGAPLCTFKETARILAGFPDERPGAVEATGGAGPASLVGLRLAKGEARPAGSLAADRAPARTSRRRAPSSHDAPQRTRPPIRPPGGPHRGGGVMTVADRDRRDTAPRSCSPPCCPPSGTSRSPGRWRPTGGTRATRACARPSP